MERGIENFSVGEILQQLQDFFRSMIADEVQKALVAAKNEPAKMYSRDEVCNLLKISKVTLWQWEKDGKLIPKRAGRRVLYAGDELQKLMGGQKL